MAKSRRLDWPTKEEHTSCSATTEAWGAAAAAAGRVKRLVVTRYLSMRSDRARADPGGNGVMVLPKTLKPCFGPPQTMGTSMVLHGRIDFFGQLVMPSPKRDQTLPNRHLAPSKTFDWIRPRVRDIPTVMGVH